MILKFISLCCCAQPAVTVCPSCKKDGTKPPLMVHLAKLLQQSMNIDGLAFIISGVFTRAFQSDLVLARPAART